MDSMLRDPMRFLSPRSLWPEHDQRIEFDLTEFRSFGSVIAVAGVICVDQGRLIQEDENTATERSRLY